MKKTLFPSLLALLLLSVMLLTGCSGAFNYENSDLSAMITLGDYKGRLSITVADLAASITDEDVQDKINTALKGLGSKAYYKKLESGAIVYGDTVGLTYKAILLSEIRKVHEGSDGMGLTADQIKDLPAISGGEVTVVSDYVIGANTFFDKDAESIAKKLEGALVGKEVGKDADGVQRIVPVTVEFPTDYKTTAIQGETVVFYLYPEYKWQAVEERELAFGDRIIVTRTNKPADETAEGAGHYENAAENKVEFVTLAEAQAWHTQLRDDFNALEAGSRFGKTITFQVNENVSWTEGEGESFEAKTANVAIDYTVTVWSIPEIRYIKWDGVVDGDEAEEGQMTFSTFCTELKLTKSEYENYADYQKKLKDSLQLERDVQITANNYQAAFKALMNASKMDESNATVQKEVAAFVKEATDNVNYWYSRLQRNGQLSSMQSYAKSAGFTDVRDYYLHTNYGATQATLETAAKEYVKKNLVLWQFLHAEKDKLSDNGNYLTDAEYDAGYAGYEKIYEGSKTLSSMDRETIRAGLIWDKACKYLYENYCDVTKKPAKN